MYSLLCDLALLGSSAESGWLGSGRYCQTLDWNLVEGVAEVQEKDDQATNDGDGGVFSYKCLHTVMPGRHCDPPISLNSGIAQVQLRWYYD
jgi:hypothetical protein